MKDGHGVLYSGCSLASTEVPFSGSMALRFARNCLKVCKKWPRGLQEIALRFARHGREVCKKWPSGLQEIQKSRPPLKGYTVCWAKALSRSVLLEAWVSVNALFTVSSLRTT